MSTQDEDKQHIVTPCFKDIFAPVMVKNCLTMISATCNFSLQYNKAILIKITHN